MSKDIMALMIVGAMGSLAIIGATVRAVVKHLGRRSAPGDDRLDQILQQLATLQQAVDATSIEVERLGEGQRFTTNLLAARATPSEAPH